MENPGVSQREKSPTLRDVADPPLVSHPELAPVLSQAMSAVIAALEFGEQTPPDLIRGLEAAAATAMAEAYEPIAEAASRLARSTETIRTTKAVGVRKRADETAALVFDTMNALQQRHDRLAQRVEAEAATAARTLARSSVPGHKLAAKHQAVRKATAVRDAASARADHRAAVAALTAAAADQAAVQLASEAEQAAVIVDRDALQAAAVIRATALSVMYEVAIDAACRHFLVPLAGSDDGHAS